MARIMNKECFPFRSLLTEHQLLGTPLPEELSRHLDRCADCTREFSETDDVVRTLRRADPLAHRADVRTPETYGQPSSGLGDRIRREVAGAETTSDPPRPRTRPRTRPRHRRRIALGVAAAFVTAAAVVVPLTMDQDQGPATSVVLVREGRMTERPGGTEVPVALSGLQAGETYRMMTVNAKGARVPSGTVRAATDEPVSTRMVTAMRKDTITALIVQDEEGRVVTHVPVVPQSTSG